MQPLRAGSADSANRLPAEGTLVALVPVVGLILVGLLVIPA